MTHALQIIPIPAFDDNYIWLMQQGSTALVVDPGDASPVLTMLNQHQLTLSTILITHHHSDHIDGVQHLLAHYPKARVFAPKLEHYVFNHTAVSEGDLIHALKVVFKVLEVPGHTLGHVAYFVQNVEAPILFCGDTLFGAGCGRLFEGTPAQMLSSLKKICQCSADTKIFCTHEYTLKNIAFALTLEPNNAQLLSRKIETDRLLTSKQPSLPSTLALELATNPFLRCASEEIKYALKLPNATELAVFTKMRHLRNTY